jgi:hypothetical protein
MIQLQKSIWRQYIGIWKALLGFVYRTTQPDAQIIFRHQLNTRQVVHLAEAIKLTQERHQLLLRGQSKSSLAAATLEESTNTLDKQCLELCISLLDHDLRGDLFESVVVGFFAAIGINEIKGVFKEAYHYTPLLSGFIKIAQMLVIQKAVAAAHEGIIAQPSDLLDEMRTQFMITGTRSPFSWASRLRVYGKKVRDSTTCLGYITWSDDRQSVSYKDIPSLTMEAFRGFVRNQVIKAQDQLAELLLLHPDETRESLGLQFWMHRITDNAVENQKG